MWILCVFADCFWGKMTKCAEFCFFCAKHFSNSILYVIIYAEQCCSVIQLLEDENVYQSMAKAVNLYGDGTACARIAEAIKWHFGFRQDRPEDFNV